jgi:pyrroloquinoline quinone biosynthesis protein E
MVDQQRALIPSPVSLLAEITHRCPLQCPYCSNPLELDRAARELDTATWQRVLDQATALGVLQTHFSGGEPTARRDLVDLVRHAAGLGQYSNLITSGVLLDQAKLDALVEAGLDHLQLSIQDSRGENADRIAGYKNGHAKKMNLAGMVRAAGLPLTINAVVHRQNLDHLADIVDLAVDLGAQRLEVAHVQYYGWALVNRAALMPTRAQSERAIELVDAARARLKGILAIDYVVPDYYARYPKACMGGWGRQNLNITPSGKVLPCHAAETITSLTFESVTERPLAEIWYHSAAFNAFRGTAWMPEPCRSCDRRTIDFGGCRCQAFAIAGRAEVTDPACALSSMHDALVATANEAAQSEPPPFVYRRFGNAGPSAVTQSTPVREAEPATG